MLPKHAAQVSHPDLATQNVLVRGVGHLAMLVDGAIAHRIAATLAQLEPTAPEVGLLPAVGLPGG
jgi:hypothetical protein